MTTSNIRVKLHDYIDKGDEKLLKLMYAVAKEYNSGDEFSFSDEDMAVFEERRKKRIAGESSVYSWEVAKEIITGKSAHNEF